jgi:hypothetical protein
VAAPNIQICASHALTGIEAITAPNGGSARGYQELVLPLADRNGGRPGRRPDRIFMRHECWTRTPAIAADRARRSATHWVGVAADCGAPSGIVPSAGDHGAAPRLPVSAGLDAPRSSLFTGLVLAALGKMLRQFQPA